MAMLQKIFSGSNPALSIQRYRPDILCASELDRCSDLRGIDLFTVLLK